MSLRGPLESLGVTASSWEALRRYASKQPSGPITITMGTACAGSEFYLAAFPFFGKRELSKRLHRHFRFDHRWSCELDPMKRQWIMDNFAPPKLFADLKELHCSDHQLTHRSEMSLQADPHLRGTHGAPANADLVAARPGGAFGEPDFRPSDRPLELGSGLG